jgi:hypothetical protein
MKPIITMRVMDELLRTGFRLANALVRPFIISTCLLSAEMLDQV